MQLADLARHARIHSLASCTFSGTSADAAWTADKTHFPENVDLFNVDIPSPDNLTPSLCDKVEHVICNGQNGLLPGLVKGESLREGGSPLPP